MEKIKKAAAAKTGDEETTLHMAGFIPHGIDRDDPCPSTGLKAKII